MGTKHSKLIDSDKSSTSSVFEKSLSSNQEKNKISPKNRAREEIINELKEEINLPRENDQYVQREDILGQNDQFALEKLYENDDEEYLNEDNEDFLNKFLPEDSYNMKRSKTFVPKPAMLETPRLKLKDSDNDNFMSPFKLSIKSFGILPQKNQMPNKILLDFQKDIMDCKSCNDNEEEIFEEYLLFNADTEKTTPNPEDLLDLLNCRKKMIKFRNSINYSPCNEYENILNCDKIIENIQDETESHHGKKKINLE